MLARLRKAKEEGEGGFTLIELLVVIIIIGILAAIAIPTFLSQREKGYKADMKSTVKNAATAVESAATETGGDYSDIVAGDLAGEGFKLPDTQTAGFSLITDATAYCISVADTRVDDIFYVYTSATGVPTEGAAPCATAAG